MQTLKIVQTPNYDFDRQKMSTDDKIVATENVNTMSMIDSVAIILSLELTLC